MSAKTFTAIEKVGSGAWRYTWTGTAPYRVLVNYAVYDEMYGDTSLTVLGTDFYEPPVVEVCEQGETVESESYPRKPTAQWFGNPRATSYNIYQTGVYWDSIPEDGRTYYQYSGFTAVDDGVTINATIMQVDANGNESASVPFQWLTFRYPDAPHVTYSYEPSTGTFTVTARA